MPNMPDGIRLRVGEAGAGVRDLPKYSLERCEEMLIEDPAGLARLFAISQGHRVSPQRGTYKPRGKAKSASA
jgi:hypothetical protein